MQPDHRSAFTEPLRILVAHNRYQQAGGEDRVVQAEVDMLSRRGHDVQLMSFDNDQITSPSAKVLAAVRTFYSPASYRRVEERLKSFAPQILHVHNFLPVLSPSVFFAAAARGTAVVHTLHNFRLICSKATFFRDGHVCEECLEKRSFVPGVKHACYRGSRAGSALVGGTMALHDALHTWRNKVHRYIALTEFAATKLAQMRVPADRIRVKPNFTEDVGSGDGEGGFALFVGRLSDEKGLETLLAADALGALPIPLKIAGDGPMRDQVAAASKLPGTRIEWLERQTPQQVRALMKSAAVLIVPSVWYEGFPMVIVEALSLGLPVIASRIGGLPEIIEHGVSGLLFQPGSPQSLGEALRKFSELSPDRVTSMRQAARDRFLSNYNEQTNSETLLHVYQEAMALAALG